jgi:hypothetical protein
MVRVLKRIRGKWYVYEVTTKYLGPVKEVGTEEEKKKIVLNPDFFAQGRFRFRGELESIARSLLRGEAVEIAGIYIHGSQVRGRYGTGSDLDVWIEVKPRKKADEILYSGPTLLTATGRMDAPRTDIPRVKLGGAEVEVCRSTLRPKPPYFDIRRQRLVG